MRHFPAPQPNKLQATNSDGEPCKYNEPKKRGFWEQANEPSVYINVLMVIIVTFYTFFAHRQVEETQKANAIAKKALTEVNKPYVAFTIMKPLITTDVDGASRIHMGSSWVNLGNTPANSVSAYNCDPIIRDDEIPPIFHCNISEKDHPEFILGPKQERQVIGPVIKEEDLEATVHNKKAIYIFGGVTYTDNVGFDSNGIAELRETRFCVRISRAKAKIVNDQRVSSELSDPGSHIEYGCNGFSCTDKNCSKL